LVCAYGTMVDDGESMPRSNTLPGDHERRVPKMKREHEEDTMERKCERVQMNVRHTDAWETVEMGTHED
jgi:hypothetical protein